MCNVNVKWLRPGEIFKEPRLFPPNGPSPNDAKQSSKLGNCYFVAAISVLAERTDMLRRNVAWDQEAGTFKVTLFHRGSWKTQTLDDLLPCKITQSHANDGEQDDPSAPATITSLLFAKARSSGSHANFLYVSALEKAYAKLYGGYEAIVGGDIGEALHDISGCPVIDVKLDVKNDAKMMWREVIDRWAMGQLACCGLCISDDKEATAAAEHSKIKPNHAYSVLDIVEKGGKGYLKLRNPWGKGVSEDKAPRGYENNDDPGTFWLTWKNFRKSFSNLYWCLLPASGPSCTANASETLRGKWDETSAGGCCKYSTWRKNPIFTLTSSGNDSSHGKAGCILTLSQEDRRLRRRSRASSTWEPLSYHQIGLEVVRISNGDPNDQVIVNKNYKVVAKTSFWNKRSVSLEIPPVQKGETLLVVPSTFFPGQHGDFSISLTCHGSIEYSLQRAEPKQRAVCPVLCKFSQGHGHVSQVHENQQFQLTVSKPVKVVAYLRYVEKPTMGIASAASAEKILKSYVGMYAFKERLGAFSQEDETSEFPRELIIKPKYVNALEISVTLDVTERALLVPALHKKSSGKDIFEVAVEWGDAEAQVQMKVAENVQPASTVDGRNEGGMKSSSTKQQQKRKQKRKKRPGTNFDRARKSVSMVSDLYAGL
tara:strand:- start:1401 stop:3359 length:1959 start_codon:yes stop_codon:yes gene_type:complete